MMDNSGWINCGTILRCALQIFPEVLSGISPLLLMVVTLVALMPPILCLNFPLPVCPPWNPTLHSNPCLRVCLWGAST